MATFEIKEQLDKSTQDRIDAINAKDSAIRTVEEAAFLAARLQYATNRIIRYDTNTPFTREDKSGLDKGETLSTSTYLILEAEGNTLPVGYEGFKKGAFFRDLDRAGQNLYVNVGTASSAQWVLATGAEGSVSASLSASTSVSLSPSVSVSRRRRPIGPRGSAERPWCRPRSACCRGARSGRGCR